MYRAIYNLLGTDVYLRRWSYRLPFGWSLKVHQIRLPDHDRCQHSHPWRFLRVILSGGYIEERSTLSNPDQRSIKVCKPWRPWAPWRLYWCGGDFIHRIIRLPHGPSWSLLLVSPRYREWGFCTRYGWVHWKRFLSETLDRVNWCD